MSERNKPCEQGRALGADLARFADRAEEHWRAELGFVPVRCESCAFKAGTYPNGCLSTTADAMKCAMEHRPFMCHQFPGWRKDSGKAESLCGGYLLLAGLGVPAVEAPWPYCT